MSVTFYIDTIVGGRQVIKSQEHEDLQVMVYNLKHEPFAANPRMLQMYGDAHGDYLAFEMDRSISEGSIDLFASALLWYAVYLGNPDMELQIADPRA
jgi:hypothetical protein